MKHFRTSILISLLCFAVAFFWGGQETIHRLNDQSGWSNPIVLKAAIQSLIVTVILSVMEVSLSFDNAVVNASVLKNWNAFWRKLFLTAGMIVAVFGMRLVFPILIVAVATGKSMLNVAHMAIEQPQEYAARLTEHHVEVAIFGGVFLLLVFLNFLIDEAKDFHWIGWIERKMAALGKLSALSVFLALVALLAILGIVEHPEQRYAALISGVGGIVTYLAVDILGSCFDDEGDANGEISNALKGGSIGSFMYLEVLDASFSFDGVIGSFAITNDVVIIMLGLGVGALFVRSLTLFLIEKETLEQYVFLEHGAHYAIGVLAFIMLISVKYHVPEVVTGLIGVAFIVLAIISSVKYKKNNPELLESGH